MAHSNGIKTFWSILKRGYIIIYQPLSQILRKMCEGVPRSSQLAQTGCERADVVSGHAVFVGAVALRKLSTRLLNDIVATMPDLG